jgi:hypothetical protein
MINVTMQFPEAGPDDSPISHEDVKQWALAVKQAVLGFNGIEIKLIEIKDSE